MDCEEPNQFAGIRFNLAGFNSTLYQQAKEELVTAGAVHVAQYSPDVTHVIVHNLLYDDPICVAARRDQKALVTSLWLEHSLDAGEPLDMSLIMYSPPKGPNGIPGAEKFEISLTGYPGPDREDIMTMVGLMGARFSKSFSAKSATHLICYKFEGEKYELAKRLDTVKIVNHQWLHDCLKAWEIVPEELYTASGYELDLMQTVANDSDEENVGIPKNVTDPRKINGIPISQIEIGKNHEHLVGVTISSTSSLQKGLPKTLIIDDGKLPLKPDQATESILKTEKLSPGCLDKSNNDDIFHLPGQIVNNLPSYSESSKGTSDSSVEKLRSVNNQKAPEKSALPPCISEDLGNLSRPCSTKPSSSHAVYSSPFSSVKPPSTSRTPLHIEKSGITGRRPEEHLRLDDAQKSPSSLFVEGLCAKPALDGEGLCGLQMTGGKSSVTHTNTESQKLTAPNSKLMDAADTATPVNSLGKGRSSSLSFGINGGSDTSRETADKSGFSSLKCNEKTSAGLKSVAFGKMQVSGSNQLDAENGLSIAQIAGCTTPVDINKNAQPQNVLGKVSVSAETKDYDAAKLGNTELNSVDKIGNSVSKPTRKKTVARKTLGSRPKAAKNISGAQKGSLSDNVAGADAVLHPFGMMVEEQNGNSFAADKFLVSPGVCAATIVGNKLTQMFDMEDSNHSDPFNYETDAPPDLVVQHDKSANEISHSTEIISRETSGVGLPAVKSNGKVHSKNEAISGRSKGKSALDGAVEDAAGRNDSEEEGRMQRETETVTGNKRRGTRLVKKNVEVENVNELIVSYDQGTSDGTEHSGALKRRRGTQFLNKQDFPAEVEEETELDLDRDEDQNDCEQNFDKLPGASNLTEGPMNVNNENGAVTGNVHSPTKGMKRAGKKKRGTLLLDKAEDPVSLRKEKLLSNSARSSSVPPGPLDEVKEDNTGIGTNQGTAIDKKLSGKKRHGTLVLNKHDSSVEEGKENEKESYPNSVNNQDTTEGKKLAGKKRRGTLVINKPDSSVELGMENEKENDPSSGNNQDTTKGKTLAGKKRRGTLILNKPENSVEVGKENKKENDPSFGNNQDTTKGKKLAGKKRRGTLILNKSKSSVNEGKENEQVLGDNENKNKSAAHKSNQAAQKKNAHTKPSDIQSDLTAVKREPACFIVSGHRLQRKDFQQVIKRLKGKLCRDSHQWSYQATHFIIPDPIRRTEKFFAAAASGRWILKTDYLTACSQAGKFLPEEPYEWHKNELTEDGAVDLEAPRKWRHLREKTGHGAFYGMSIVIYGECIAPPLDTLKRVVKAGDGTILATSPPYTRFLSSGIDFAIVSPGMPREDIWIQEFLKHEIPCVLADYLVEYVCKPGFPLDRHVQYNTHEWAAKSISRLTSLSKKVVADVATPESQVSDDLACQVCGSIDRAEVMLICGDESGSTGCGVGTHIDCCDPPLEDVPEDDWFCPKCSEGRFKTTVRAKKRSVLKNR